jgi:hypothetical protein
MKLTRMVSRPVEEIKTLKDKNGNDIEVKQIVYRSFVEEISDAEEKEIKDEWARNEEAARLNKYREDRAREYPSIQEQLDDIYHNGFLNWRLKIKAIKEKYPKPEGQ